MPRDARFYFNFIIMPVSDYIYFYIIYFKILGIIPYPIYNVKKKITEKNLKKRLDFDLERAIMFAC